MSWYKTCKNIEPSVINLKLFLRLIFQAPDLALGLLQFSTKMYYHIINNWLGLEFEKIKLCILSLNLANKVF